MKNPSKLGTVLIAALAICMGVGVGFAAWALPGIAGIGSNSGDIAADPDYVALSIASHSITSYCQSGFIVPDAATSSFTGYKLTNTGQMNIGLSGKVGTSSSARTLNISLTIQNASSTYPFSSSDVTKTYAYGTSFDGSQPSPATSFSGTPTSAGVFTIPVSVPANKNSFNFAFRITLTCAYDKFTAGIYNTLTVSGTTKGYKLAVTADWSAS